MKAPKPSRAPARPYLPIQEALLVNAMSASTTGAALDTLLARSINTANSTVYDRAIDSVYLSAHTGGSHLHHLLDGQHDLAGAFAAAQAVAPNDSLTHQVLGTAHHLSKDLFSVMGLPVLSLNPKTYCDSADWMQQHLGLSKAWQADLLQINGMELLGGSLAAGTEARWRKLRVAQAWSGCWPQIRLRSLRPPSLCAWPGAVVRGKQKCHCGIGTGLAPGLPGQARRWLWAACSAVWLPPEPWGWRSLWY